MENVSNTSIEREGVVFVLALPLISFSLLSVLPLPALLPLRRQGFSWASLPAPPTEQGPVPQTGAKNHLCAQNCAFKLLLKHFQCAQERESVCTCVSSCFPVRSIDSHSVPLCSVLSGDSRVGMARFGEGWGGGGVVLIQTWQKEWKIGKTAAQCCGSTSPKNSVGR